MRIGIMTMHRVPNYGSFMQAFSLKTMIESFGYEVVFIDYTIKPDIEHKNNIKYNILCALKMIKKITLGTYPVTNLFYKLNQDQTKQHAKFIYDIYHSCDHMLGITSKFHVRTKVDTLVIGSDEVFNCLQSGFNVGYSLELFGKKHRAQRLISYAASFGNTTLERLNFYGVTEEIGRLLNKFDALSVRDKNSLSIVQSISDNMALIHMDPVLISGIENMHWRKIKKNYKYLIIYGYEYRFSKSECEKIVKFAHSHQLRVIALGEDQLICDEHICCRPDEIINYFRNAEYVISDTFHGTIFSVITHKKFLTIIRSSNNGQYGNEEKISSLVESLNLRSRLVIEFDEIEAKIDQPIDYKSVDAIRKAEQIRSLSYLKENLK